MTARPSRLDRSLWTKRGRRVAWVGLGLATLVTLSTGCQTNESQSQSSQGDFQSASATATEVQPHGSADSGDLSNLNIAERVERQYVIGPAAAGSIEYRVDWQTDTDPDADSGIKHVVVRDDAVFVLDGQNFLSRLRRADGRRVWRIPVGQVVTEILGLAYTPKTRRVYLAAGGTMLVLDAGTGAQVGRQELQRIINTGMVQFGPFLIYGARNGQLVWHNYSIAYQWKAYQVSSSIKVRPVLADRYVITTGAGGLLVVLSAEGNGRLWSKRMLDDVVAAPVVEQGVLYVAATDQFIRAFDLFSGRKLWEELTGSPLTDSPVVVGSRLYQNVASEGLVCFEALPRNSRRGVILWTSESAGGVPLTEHGGRLLVWNDATRTLNSVDTLGGSIVKSVSLPQVDHISTTARQDGELFAASRDGRVLRLVPRSGGSLATSGP